MSDIEILDIDLDDIIIESGNESEKMASNVSVDSENDRKKNVRKVVSGGGKAPHVAVSFKPVRKPQVAETEKINERRIGLRSRGRSKKKSSQNIECFDIGDSESDNSDNSDEDEIQVLDDTVDEIEPDLEEISIMGGVSTDGFCDLCGLYLDTISDIEQHHVEVHKIVLCKWCNKKITLSKIRSHIGSNCPKFVKILGSHCSIHNKMETDEMLNLDEFKSCRPWSCDACGQRYDKKSLMEPAETPDSFVCPGCLHGRVRSLDSITEQEKVVDEINLDEETATIEETPSSEGIVFDIIEDLVKDITCTPNERCKDLCFASEKDNISAPPQSLVDSNCEGEITVSAKEVSELEKYVELTEDKAKEWENSENEVMETPPVVSPVEKDLDESIIEVQSDITILGKSLQDVLQSTDSTTNSEAICENKGAESSAPMNKIWNVDVNLDTQAKGIVTLNDIEKDKISSCYDFEKGENDSNSEDVMLVDTETPNNGDDHAKSKDILSIVNTEKHLLENKGIPIEKSTIDIEIVALEDENNSPEVVSLVNENERPENSANDFQKKLVDSIITLDEKVSEIKKVPEEGVRRVARKSTRPPRSPQKSPIEEDITETSRKRTAKSPAGSPRKTARKSTTRPPIAPQVLSFMIVDEPRIVDEVTEVSDDSDEDEVTEIGRKAEGAEDREKEWEKIRNEAWDISDNTVRETSEMVEMDTVSALLASPARERIDGDSDIEEITIC